jgi:hypothetical protein
MVLSTLMIKSRKSEELKTMTTKVGAAIAPLIWAGTIITTLVWAWIVYQNPLNILGLVNTLILILILILTWRVGSKTMNPDLRKLPLISTIFLAISWWIFVFLSLAVI